MKNLRKGLAFTAAISLLLILGVFIVLAEVHPGAYWGFNNSYRLDGQTLPNPNPNQGVPQASSFAIKQGENRYADNLTVGIRAWRLGECGYASKVSDNILGDYSINITFTAPDFYPADTDYATSKHKAVKSENGTVYTKTIHTSFDGTHSGKNWYNGSAHEAPHCPRVPDDD